MSIHAITAVLDFAPDHWNAGTRMVAVAIADRVNMDEGGKCWPSLNDLSRRTGLSTRQVRTHLRIIESDGWIQCLGQRPGAGGQPVSNLWIWRQWLQVGRKPTSGGGRKPTSALP